MQVILFLHFARSAPAKRWKHSSAGRASALQAEGHRFEPCCFHHRRRSSSVWLECRPVTAEVEGSSPFCVATDRPIKRPVFFAQIAQSVEQGTENPRVGGSIPPLGTKATLMSGFFIVISSGWSIILHVIIYYGVIRIWIQTASKTVTPSRLRK